MIAAADAIAIRNMFSTGEYTKTALANLFGCCADTITNVLNRSADKDVYVRTSLSSRSCYRNDCFKFLIKR